MKRFVLYTAAAVVMAATFTACGKYEEGPGLSLRSRKARVEGEWKVSKATINGADATADFAGETWELTKDGDATFRESDGSSYTGTWEFTSDDEKIRFCTSSFGLSVCLDYDILMLKNKEMMVRYSADGDTYEYTLEQLAQRTRSNTHGCPMGTRVYFRCIVFYPLV